MHLTPHEIEKLMLHNAGVLAQKRLARGLKLNYPESVALIATQILEFIRDGKSVATLMDLGRQLLGRNQVMPGVSEMLAEVQIEGTFPDGSKLVTIHHPIASENGNLSLALHGSFLPLPDPALFATAAEPSPIPGEILTQPGDIEANANRKTLQLHVTNLGDRPVQVGSHYHFVETNASLKFDRIQAIGMRLDIPAGTAVRFEPGETRTVNLVEIAGEKIIYGGNNLVDGPITPQTPATILKRITEGGFEHESA